jgi:hypothetical protein
MTYIGPPLVYSFNEIGTGCGMIAPHACAILAGTVYWWGLNSFFTYGQSVQPIPCDVWDQVFPLIDQSNIGKCWAWANSSYNEVWFWYPVVGGTGECTAYVKR